MKCDEVISFPHIGVYHVPITYFLKHVTSCHVMPSPKITKRTLELGTKYAPDYVCIPFKYNLGNYIEALENGATILLQAGGGCRYGYYAEVQEKILRDLGYTFDFFPLVDVDKVKVRYLYKKLKEINPKLSVFRFVRYGLITLLMIVYIDRLEKIIRKNIGFEKEKGTFRIIESEFLEDFAKVKGIFSLHRKYRNYRKKLGLVPIQKPKNCLKVGIIGELYTAMEPFATFFLEEELARMNIEITRFTDLTYLLFQKALSRKRHLKKVSKYCKYTLGADGMDNVFRANYLIENNYDGIIHTKPFGCTPEIGAIPIIDKVCKEHNMPIIYFSFDSETSEVGIQTRLEAFYDMILERKKKG